MASIRKRNDKYQVQIRRKGFPPVSRCFRNLKDAKEWSRHMETLADRKDLPVDTKVLDSLTLGDLIRRYRDEVVPAKRGAEIETVILNSFLKQPINNRPVSEITTADFVAYRDKRLAEIRPISLKRQLSPISNMFEVAKTDWGLPLKENPLKRLKINGTDRRRERRLRAGEYERLIAAANQRRSNYLSPIIGFALETAMRRGEILAMRWDDVDMDRRSILIPESKNGFSRIIPLTEGAATILGKLKRCDENVFPVTAVALRQIWDRTTRNAGITDLHFHDLRHEAISRLFELGLTTPEVASISGHRDMRMLFRYAHANHTSIRGKLNRNIDQK
ncbi:MAG: site-specific integrase [Nitratireductor sp.]|nr:site-specific integrase [Nitratireductor sp.]